MLRGPDQPRPAHLERLQRLNPVRIGEVEPCQIQRYRLGRDVTRIAQFCDLSTKKLAIDMDEGTFIPLLYVDTESHPTGI